MYVVNGNWTFAIDVATGRQIWRTPVQYERGALRVATSGALMRARRRSTRASSFARRRRHRARARHEDRQGDLEAEVCRVEGRLQGRHRAG